MHVLCTRRIEMCRHAPATRPGNTPPGVRADVTQKSIRGTGPRPPPAASCVLSAWRVSSYGHTQEQLVLTMQPAMSCLHGIRRTCAGVACTAAPPRRFSRGTFFQPRVSYCGTGSRPPLAARCVLSTRRAASYIGARHACAVYAAHRNVRTHPGNTTRQHASGREGRCHTEEYPRNGP